MLAPRQQGRFLKGNHYSPGTQFQPGERPGRHTEIQRGEHLSVATEFKRGQDAHNRLPVGSVRIRVETNTGLERAWIKVAEPSVWRKRAVLVWESQHGPLPRGHVVHHRDRDSLNDDPGNLQALTKRAHRLEHHEEILSARLGS